MSGEAPHGNRPAPGPSRLPWLPPEDAPPPPAAQQAPRRRRPLSSLEMFSVVALVLTALAIMIVLALDLPLEMIGGKLMVLAVLGLVAVIGKIGMTNANRR